MIIIIFLLTDRPAREGIRRRKDHHTLGVLGYPANYFFPCPPRLAVVWEGSSLPYTGTKIGWTVCGGSEQGHIQVRQWRSHGSWSQVLWTAASLSGSRREQRRSVFNKSFLVETCCSDLPTLTLFRCYVAPTICILKHCLDWSIWILLAYKLYIWHAV